MKLRCRDDTPAADASSSWLIRRVERQVRSIVPNDESATARAVTDPTVVTKVTADDYPRGNGPPSVVERTIAS